MRLPGLLRQSRVSTAAFFVGAWLSACDGVTAPVAPTLIVVTDSLPRALPGETYGQPLVATGGTLGYTWSLTPGSGALPPGLGLSPAGIIAGTPTEVGVFAFTVRVHSGDSGNGEKALSITVPTVLQPDQLCADYPGDAMPTFADALVEDRVRHRIRSQERQDGGTGEGWWPEPLRDLTCDVVAAVSELTVTAHPHPARIDLAGAQNLTGLTYLNVVSSESIANLDAISGLTALGTLELWSRIEDLAPLAGLAGLERLDLDFNAVADVEPLRELTSLTYLSLRGNRVSDLTPLSAVTGLVHLDLNENAIADIGPLGALITLEELYLSENSVSDIGPLSSLGALRRLSLAQNAISDVGPLAGLTALRILELEENSITDITALAGLSELRTLRLYRNPIGDVTALGDLSNLQDLHLGETSISDISALGGLTSLHYLALSNNAIVDLGPVEGLVELDYLFLNNNPDVSDIQPLLDNPGIGAWESGPGPNPGDWIYLNGTQVSCADVAALEAKGANVFSDCP